VPRTSWPKSARFDLSGIGKSKLSRTASLSATASPSLVASSTARFEGSSPAELLPSTLRMVLRINNNHQVRRLLQGDATRLRTECTSGRGILRAEPKPNLRAPVRNRRRSIGKVLCSLENMCERHLRCRVQGFGCSQGLVVRGKLARAEALRGGGRLRRAHALLRAGAARPWEMNPVRRGGVSWICRPDR